MSRRLLFGLVLVALVVVTTPPSRAHAATCEERLTFVTHELATARRPARVWSWAWAIGYLTVGSAQLIAAPLLNDEGRQKDFYVGGGRTLLGVVGFVVLPLAVLREEPKIRERVATAGAGADTCALAADAERALERSGASERRGKSLLKHSMVVLVNVAAGLILGLGYDRWGSAALTAGTGILGGEIMIWTQPTRSVDAWRRYREGGLAEPSPAQSWLIAPTLHAGGAGLSFAASF